MADVHAVISLGIGSPADIPHFLLFGLSINDTVVDAVSDVTVTVRASAATVIVPSWVSTVVVPAIASEVDSI